MKKKVKSILIIIAITVITSNLVLIKPTQAISIKSETNIINSTSAEPPGW